MSSYRNKWYVVWRGTETGVCDSWAECEARVKGYPGAQYKAFATQEEAVMAFRNGNVMSIDRGSINGCGGYDCLTLTYEGNRLQGISDDAVIDDYLGDIPQAVIGSYLVTLDDNGRIKTDESRGVTNVKYNPLGLPSSITMGSDFTIINSYLSDGRLVNETMREYYLAQVKRYDRVTGDTIIVYVPRLLSSVSRRHLGDFIIETGKNPRSYHNWGYVEWLNDSTVQYYYYERDHQGSVRTVRNASFGVVQSTAYTASGLPVTRIYSGVGDHHLHTGKPWQDTGGLAWYNNRARWYDPITMRFLAPDPLADKYHDISPWAWCGNNPLRYSDPTGEVIRTTVNGVAYDYILGEDGTYGFYNCLGELYEGPNSFMFDLTVALQEIQNGKFGKMFISDLINSENVVNVEYTTTSNSFNSSNDTANWNPDSSQGGISKSIISGYSTSRPSYIGLGHELAHAADKFYGKFDESTWFLTKDKVIDRTEIYACQIENMLRKEHNISLRTHYYYYFEDNGIVPLDASAIPNFDFIYSRPFFYLPIYFIIY